jgi:eukaryotic-like serine/threonine-protein kinase
MTALHPGTVLSHYRIVSRIGAGGMGEVYRAHDVQLGRSVALKILPPELVDDSDRVRRFEQEAKAASALSHPHIVTIHEIGRVTAEGEGRPFHFIAMELVEGRTLRELLATDIPLRDLVEILSQAADALAKAHAAGIVHRDLKPENIMVTGEGYAKVLDFGLAKLVESPSGSSSESAVTLRKQTTEGVVLGTPAYMSPEQVRGQKIDHRSDIFSFGGVLYEAITRRRPFQADTKFDVLHQIVRQEPRPLNELAPTAPGELRRLVRRCLAKDPERRYQSMKDIALELRDIAQEFDSFSFAVPPRPTTAARGRAWWPAAALALVAAAAGFGVAGFRRSSQAPEPNTSIVPARMTQLTRTSGVETQPRISPDGNFIVYVSDRDGDEDIYLQRLGGFNAINLTQRSDEDDNAPAISPDGNHIAFRSERDGGGIFIMGATGESVRRLTDFCFDPSWSPAGDRIACTTVRIDNPLSKGGVSHLWIVSVATGEGRQLGEFDAVQAAWSPNGDRIAFWSNRGQGSQRDIFTVDANGGTPIAVTDDEPADWAPAWSHDGRHLYFSSTRGGTMGLWRIPIDQRTGKAGGPPVALPTAARWNGPSDVSKDGKRVVFSAADLRSAIFRLPLDPGSGAPTGPPVPVYEAMTRAVECDVSPDGAWIAFRSEGEQEDLFAIRADGSEIRQLTDDTAHDRGLKWSPDGTQIAFYSDREGGTHEIWTIASDGSRLTRITEGSEPLYFPRWAPDGKRMAASNENGTYILDLTGPLPVPQPEPLPPIGPDLWFRAFAWSDDGKWLGGRTVGARGKIEPGIYVFSMETKVYEKIGEDLVRYVDWMPDSRRLIVYTVGGSIDVIDRITRESRNLTTIPDSGWTFAGISVSSDGRDLFYIVPSAEADIWMLTLQE